MTEMNIKSHCPIPFKVSALYICLFLNSVFCMDWGSSLDCVTFAIMEHLAEMFCKRNIKVQIENKQG